MAKRTTAGAPRVDRDDPGKAADHRDRRGVAGHGRRGQGSDRGGRDLAAGRRGSVGALTLATTATTAYAIWNPPVRDLAAHTFRADYFGQYGFAIWNGSWYGGHHLLSYSVLFPSLAALLSPIVVGVLSAVASAVLFDRLIRERWGDRARWAGLWFAGPGSVAMLANGWLAFALGTAFALGALRALQLGRGRPALLSALACALSSPVAAVFLAGIVVVGAAAERPAARALPLAVVAGALAPVAALGGLFPGTGEQPFWLSAYWPLALWGLGALVVTHGLPAERRFRAVVLGYLAAATVVWLVPNALGGNAVRLGALFGGPVLAAIVLANRVRVPAAVVGLTLAGSLAWQVVSPAVDVAESLGDPSTGRAYYAPVSRWLRSHGGDRARVEVPFTFNHWEVARLSPELTLARGWLRQLDVTRNEVFYEGRLTHRGYRDWLRENAVRYVAVSDAQLDYSAQVEDDLVRSEPGYLRLRTTLAHWRVYEVVGREPIVRSTGGGRARLISLRPQAFTLRVARSGRFVVRVRATPYWSLSEGAGCVGRAGDWTLVRADRPGVVRVSIGLSAGAVWRVLRRKGRAC